MALQIWMKSMQMHRGWQGFYRECAFLALCILYAFELEAMAAFSPDSLDATL